jgi:hypothetical protein
MEEALMKTSTLLLRTADPSQLIMMVVFGGGFFWAGGTHAVGGSCF